MAVALLGSIPVVGGVPWWAAFEGALVGAGRRLLKQHVMPEKLYEPEVTKSLGDDAMSKRRAAGAMVSGDESRR